MFGKYENCAWKHLAKFCLEKSRQYDNYKPLNVRIMKKLENPKLKKRRDYLRSNVLPRLQEMQRDLFGNEKLFVTMSTGLNGAYISASVSVFEEPDKIADSFYPKFFFNDSNEQLESEYEKLTDFINKYSA